MQAFVHARIHALPYYLDPSSAALNPTLSCIGARHKGRLLTVAGTVVRAHGVQLFEAYRAVECAQCKALLRVHVSVTDPAVAQLPEECPKEGCDSSSFRKVEDSGPGYTNYQEVNIQVRTNVATTFH
jgi:DNA helicase MCM9